MPEVAARPRHLSLSVAGLALLYIGILLVNLPIVAQTHGPAGSLLSLLPLLLFFGLIFFLLFRIYRGSIRSRTVLLTLHLIYVGVILSMVFLGDRFTGMKAPLITADSLLGQIREIAYWLALLFVWIICFFFMYRPDSTAWLKTKTGS